MSFNLASLKRWHWLAISVLVGLAAGYAAHPSSMDVRDYGEGLNSQRDFERFLVSESNGVRRFTDIVVHRQPLTNPAGGTRDAWIVSGICCGNASDPTDGNWHWRPKFFVADEPYQPAVPLQQLTGGVGGDRIAAFAKLPKPTIMDFLNVLKETRGVHFSHAWWRTYALATWLVASLVMIGVVWPTAIDLMLFGRLIRPREKKEPELASSPSPPLAPKPQAVDNGALDALNASIEQELAENASTKSSTTAGLATPATIRTLKGDAVTPAAAPDGAPRVFGAKTDDFYPTEKKAKTR